MYIGVRFNKKIKSFEESFKLCCRHTVHELGRVLLEPKNGLQFQNVALKIKGLRDVRKNNKDDIFLTLSFNSKLKS